MVVALYTVPCWQQATTSNKKTRLVITLAVGNVPLVWYKDEDHIGYDIEGGKIEKRQRGDKLDALLARNDSRAASRTIYDEYNDEEIVLTKEELAMIMRIR